MRVGSGLVWAGTERGLAALQVRFYAVRRRVISKIGEAESHGASETFKQSMRARGPLEVSRIAEGAIELTGISGERLRIVFNPSNDLPSVFRDGQPHKWSENFDVYRPVNAPHAISQRWMSGTLLVEAGGKVLTCTASTDGKVTF